LDHPITAYRKNVLPGNGKRRTYGTCEHKCDSKRESLKNEAIDLIDGTRSPALHRSDNRGVINSSPFPQASPVQPLNPVVILIYKNSANAINLVMMITKRN